MPKPVRREMYRISMQFKKKAPDGMETTYVRALNPIAAVELATKNHLTEYGGLIKVRAERVG